MLQHHEYLTALKKKNLEITECDELVDLEPSGFSCLTSLKSITLMSLQLHFI
uniref:Uncharacterized protein n=1 Tax=Utricularia reniformis TaxID=192314 RepID=A0A1Y0B2D9_9LAMI|nr:hypothetical protein AEK19_MT1421 [Utricularia reniformis]ART31615.1 hypothetical protein AEK19_MT1421 [Utricularia reniformis]